MSLATAEDSMLLLVVVKLCPLATCTADCFWTRKASDFESSALQSAVNKVLLRMEDFIVQYVQARTILANLLMPGLV